MSSERGIASFLVRFTQERWQGEDGRHLTWRGRVRHVQDGEERAFTDFADAVAFMQGHLDGLTRAAAAGGDAMEQERVMKESLRLWEQFASQASQMMADAMERTLTQSEAVRKQMDEALARAAQAVRGPAAEGGAAEARALREELHALRTEVGALKHRLDSLEKPKAPKRRKA